MSLHKLAEVTIKIYGLPEHCGTDEALQELVEEAEALVGSIDYKNLLHLHRTFGFPDLVDKITVEIEGP